MQRTIPYKQRFYYLLAGGILVFILAYWIAVSKTLETKQNLNDINNKLKQIETAPVIITSLKKRMVIVNYKLGENLGDISEFQKKILRRISSYCAENSLVLKEFAEVHSWQKREYQFITCYANIEGPFIPLLKLLYDLETSHSPGRIISVSFTSNEDRKLKKSRLTMSIYIQTIKLTNNDQSE